jgi:hypothetical protein
MQYYAEALRKLEQLGHAVENAKMPARELTGPVTSSWGEFTDHYDDAIARIRRIVESL